MISLKMETTGSAETSVSSKLRAVISYSSLVIMGSVSTANFLYHSMGWQDSSEWWVCKVSEGDGPDIFRLARLIKTM
jgi:hypothetical protein